MYPADENYKGEVVSLRSCIGSRKYDCRSSRFPRCSIIFLYRDLAATVRSFRSVMTAVRRVAAILGDSDQVMDWWCRDLPLPQPSTHYSWANDTVFLVSNQSFVHPSLSAREGGKMEGVVGVVHLEALQNYQIENYNFHSI